MKADKASVRKTLLRLAQRHGRPGGGSRPEALRKRTFEMQVPDLRPILEGLPWAVVGAVAARLYMPERTTHDLDIAVWHEDAPSVRRRLEAAGFSYDGELAIGGSSWHSPEGLPLDVVELRTPWARQALAEARENRDPQGLPILPLPYLVLIKFEAGRVQDLADLTRMLGQATEEQLQKVRALLARFHPDDLEDLESLIDLGRLELER
ncbi:MAG: hypothetical protein ACP5OO_08025 [Chloroflexia bacterium]